MLDPAGRLLEPEALGAGGRCAPRHEAGEGRCARKLARASCAACGSTVEVVRGPDALHRAQGDLRLLGHRRPTPPGPPEGGSPPRPCRRAMAWAWRPSAAISISSIRLPSGSSIQACRIAVWTDLTSRTAARRVRPAHGPRRRGRQPSADVLIRTIGLLRRRPLAERVGKHLEILRVGESQVEQPEPTVRAVQPQHLLKAELAGVEVRVRPTSLTRIATWPRPVTPCICSPPVPAETESALRGGIR